MHEEISANHKTSLVDLPFTIEIQTTLKCANPACPFPRSFQDDPTGNPSQTVALLDLDTSIPHILFSDNKKVHSQTLTSF